VGNRVALALLSLAEGPILAQAICNQDKTFIARAEGVGPKLAARLVTELKDKVAKIAITFPVAGASVPPGVTFLSPQPFANTAARDAVAALMALGYRSFEANQAIQSIMPENDDQLSVEDLIRLGLAKLGRA
jgi:Holliday junction DNA helicase RuvA